VLTPFRLRRVPVSFSLMNNLFLLRFFFAVLTSPGRTKPAGELAPRGIQE
jgi:hypothetical protein